MDVRHLVPPSDSFLQKSRMGDLCKEARLTNERGRIVTCAGDEVDGVVAVLRVLPELDVGVVEDIAVGARVVEGLGAQHHSHVIAAIQHRHHLQEKVRVRHLYNHNLIRCESRGPISHFT